MKIKVEIIERIRGRRDIKHKLMSALNSDRFKLNRWINRNDHEGKLVTLTALKIISEGLNVKQSEITEN
jgi:hypothetical protein